jgi:peptidyl-tRNA hydrolase, PTH1 family
VDARLIVGLGNPGDAYAATRHNVGFRVIDRLSAMWKTPGFARRGESLVAEVRGAGDSDPAALLVKPQMWMNRSGEAVLWLREAFHEVPLTGWLVVADDLSLPLGRLRFRAGGSCGGHNGLASIEAALGTPEYPRLRIGIGIPAPDAGGAEEAAPHDRASPPPWIDWVLSGFTAEEEAVLDKVVPVAAEAVRDWLDKGLSYCQNLYNGWRIESAQPL